jgi:hypothetical protein
MVFSRNAGSDHVRHVVESRLNGMVMSSDEDQQGTHVAPLPCNALPSLAHHEACRHMGCIIDRVSSTRRGLLRAWIDVDGVGIEGSVSPKAWAGARTSDG